MIRRPASSAGEAPLKRAGDRETGPEVGPPVGDGSAASPLRRSSPARGGRKAGAGGDSTSAPGGPLAGPVEGDILEERGEVEQNLIEIAARDVDRTDENEELLSRERERKPDTFYSNLIYTLANIRYPEDEARLVWGNLVTHKAEMSQLLGRNVGIRVAALDFFRNVAGKLGDVKIVESSDYIQTARLAITDGLTGLLNHWRFQNRLARSLERASHERVPVSLLMVDIDHFKRYNDRFGHIAGDVALREVASALRRACAAGAAPPKQPPGPRRRGVEGDRPVSRYGGEEFTVILHGIGKDAALDEAECLRREVEALTIPGERPGGGRKLTISVGVATYPEDASDRSGLIDWADLSLYLAKTGGRNRVVSCPVDRRAAARHHAHFEVQLRKAGADEPLHGFSVVDIGAGGVAVAGEGLPPTGSRVRLSFWRRDSREEGTSPTLEIGARVAWKRAESRLGELAGLEFGRVSARDREELARLVSGGEPTAGGKGR